MAPSRIIKCHIAIPNCCKSNQIKMYMLPNAVSWLKGSVIVLNQRGSKACEKVANQRKAKYQRENCKDNVYEFFAGFCSSQKIHVDPCIHPSLKLRCAISISRVTV